MSYKELEEQALKLDWELRTQLAQSLLKSLHDEQDNLSEEQIEKLWAGEALRRDEELESGKGKEFPVDQVIRDLKARYGKRLVHSQSIYSPAKSWQMRLTIMIKNRQMPALIFSQK